MGQKVNPKSFRLSLRKNWDSRWMFSKDKTAEFLLEDYQIRKFLASKYRNAAIPKIFIERSGRVGNPIRVKIYTSRPGLLIGRQGRELDKINQELHALTNREVFLDVQEVKKPDAVANLVAERAALDIERRAAFRKVLKKAVEAAMRTSGVKGIYIQCSGRLSGGDIARREFQRAGSVPRHTLRKFIDYGFSEANTVFGKIGIKCWICKEEDELA